MMERILEPEVMDGEENSAAYAQADFEEVDRAFVDRFITLFPHFSAGSLLDLGCGPAAISRYLCETLPDISVTGVDASQPMLDMGASALSGTPEADRIELLCGYIPGALNGDRRFDAVISNSLLHHLPDPGVLWQEIKRAGHPGAPILVVDLMRPETRSDAQQIVDTYSADEPEILKVDFFNSLCAAFTPEEVQGQLHTANLSTLTVEVISDRHIAIWGTLPDTITNPT